MYGQSQNPFGPSSFNSLGPNAFLSRTVDQYAPQSRGGRASASFTSQNAYGAPQGRTGAPSPNTGGMGNYASPVSPGGIYGTQKWAPGNGIDIFVPRGSPVYAITDGNVSQNPRMIPSPAGPVPSFLLQGSDGLTAQYTHARMTAQGRVRKGQVIGYVDDPGMDMLGPYQGMPDGFQHLDLTMGYGGGPFEVTGGNINARDFLRQVGYQGQMIGGQTRGPNGGGMGGGFPGMGGMSGGFPGMGMGSGGPGGLGGPMGMPGMGMSPGGPGGPNPFMMNPFGPQGAQGPQMPNFGSGGFGGGFGGFGGGGFGSMPAFSPGRPMSPGGPPPGMFGPMMGPSPMGGGPGGPMGQPLQFLNRGGNPFMMQGMGGFGMSGMTGATGGMLGGFGGR